MANPDGSMDGWAALQHQGPEEPLSSGLSPAAAGRQTDGRHEERGCINGRHTTAKVDSMGRAKRLGRASSLDANETD